MTVCHSCGQDVPKVVNWKAPHVTSMGEAYWSGPPIALAPAECRILMALARSGQASRKALESTYAGVTPLNVLISKLRDKLSHTPVRIKAVHGLGYRLELAS